MNSLKRLQPNALTVLSNLSTESNSEQKDLERTRSFEVDPVETEELDRLFDHLAALYESQISQIEQAWGDPDFRGTPEDSDFPDWSEALCLCFWTRDDRWSYLALHHDDEDQPLRLVAGVRLFNDRSPTSLSPLGFQAPEGLE